MDNWTIIKVKDGDGVRFDAVQGAIQMGVPIEFPDGEIIPADDFSIVATSFTESQVDAFLAKVAKITH